MAFLRRLLPPIIILQLALSLLAPAIGVSAATSVPEETAIFTDVPRDSLYFPHIQRMARQYFLTGYGNGAQVRTYRPDNPITRAEIAKIAAWIRTAETKGALWGTFTDEFVAAKKMLETLGIYYKCTATTCAEIGGKAFADVRDKTDDCKTSVSCQPWFTQYVNFGVDTGYIKGYPPRAPGEARAFDPYNSILRIHALKMAMVDDFDKPDIKDDARFKALEAKAVANSSLSPKCLNGAENFIRNKNGGATRDASNMLGIALLADRLDLFGAHCEALAGLMTYKARADFLTRPVTRKEAARYFALTTSYAPVEPDPQTMDTTINTKAENEQGVAAKPYAPPEYVRPEPTDTGKPVSDPPKPDESDSPALPNDTTQPPVAETLPATAPAADKDLPASTPPVAKLPGTQPQAAPKPALPKAATIVCPAGSAKTTATSTLNACADYTTGCRTVATNATYCLSTNISNRGASNARKFYVNVYLPVRKPDLTYEYPLYYVNCDLMAGVSGVAGTACATAGWKAPATAPVVPVVAVPPVTTTPTNPVVTTPTTFTPDEDLMNTIQDRCAGSVQVCATLITLLPELGLPADLLTKCATDRCKADRILDAMLPTLTFLDRMNLAPGSILTYLGNLFPPPTQTPTATSANPVTTPEPETMATPPIPSPTLLKNPLYEVIGISPAWITAENAVAQTFTATLKNTGTETWTKANASLAVEAGWLDGKNSKRRVRGFAATDDIPALALSASAITIMESAVAPGGVATFKIPVAPNQQPKAQQKLTLNSFAGTNIGGVYLAAVKEEKRDFRTSVANVQIQKFPVMRMGKVPNDKGVLEDKPLAPSLSKIISADTAITVMGHAVLGEYVDTYKTYMWYPVEYAPAGGAAVKGYMVASAGHAEEIGEKTMDTYYKKTGQLWMDVSWDRSENYFTPATKCLDNDVVDRQIKATLENSKVKGVVLHFTAGNSENTAKSEKDAFIEERAAHYVVDRKGNIAQSAPDYQAVGHAGYKDKLACIRKDGNAFTVGVEIPNWGAAIKHNDNAYYAWNKTTKINDWANVKWKKDASCANAKDEKEKGSEMKECYTDIWKVWSNDKNFAWSGDLVNTQHQTWQIFDDTQYEGLKSLLTYIEERYDLPHKFFYYDVADGQKVGLSYYPKDSEERKSYNQAIDSFYGIYGHHNITGKYDPGPVFDIDKLALAKP